MIPQSWCKFRLLNHKILALSQSIDFSSFQITGVLHSKTHNSYRLVESTQDMVQGKPGSVTKFGLWYYS